MSTKRTSGLPLICLVCGDVARGLNFDLMTCMSCKTFFRRHATKSKGKLRCLLKNNCDITTRTRGGCSACRLQKCLTLGMDSTLVGNRFPRQTKPKPTGHSKSIDTTKNSLPQPASLSLLRNDRSLLTIDEWNLLSNIIHAYDGVILIPHVRCLLDQQSALAPKIRSKPAAILDIVKYFYSTFQPLLEFTPYFHKLPTDACQTLLQYNSATFGTINSMFIIREANALDHPAFLIGCNTLYGHGSMESFHRFTSQLDRNGIFVKLMLLILAFSTNSNAVVFDGSVDINSISSPISIFNVQSIFLTMFWKYLVYQYGFTDAVRWFNSFVKFLLDVIQSMYERENKQHNDMVDTMVEETTRVLTMEN